MLSMIYISVYICTILHLYTIILWTDGVTIIMCLYSLLAAVGTMCYWLNVFCLWLTLFLIIIFLLLISQYVYECLCILAATLLLLCPESYLK